MRKDLNLPQGTVHRLVHDSAVLVGNPQGDPARRELHVYTPPGWSGEPSLPLLVGLAGYWGSGLAMTAWRAVGENVPERLDRLIAEGAMPPVVVAFPDCATRLGGNQYLNSTGTGRYADYLVQEIVPLVEDRFGCGGAGRRGCFGKSSGGFGAAWHGMRHADFWAAIACASADMGFEVCLLSDLYTALDLLRPHEGSIERLVTALEGKPKLAPDDQLALMVFAMSAFYDPDPAAFRCLRLPCDPFTAELYPDRWACWMAHDPVVQADAHAGELRRLKAIWLDCGNRDQFRMHYGMRRFRTKLERHGIQHRYEEYDDDDTAVDYRMERDLPFLAQALAA